MNLLANESSKQKYRYLLLVFSGMFVIVGSSPATFKLSPFSNDLIWFCFLYLLTGELKHRGTFYLISKRAWAIAFWGCYFSACAIALVSDHLKAAWEYAWFLRFFYISTYQSIFAFVGAVSLFGFFLHIHISNHKICSIIERISHHTFGIFLIHQVPLLWRTGWLWNQVFHIRQYAYQPYFPAICFVSLIICFCGCLCVDMLLEKLCTICEHITRISQLAGRLDNYIGETRK